MLHVYAQHFQRRLRIPPRFSGQHFNALGQQHSGFALHLHAVLQVFNHFDAVGQLHFQQRQWLARQRRAGFGGVALPRQGVGNVEFGGVQQRAGFVGPFSGNGFLVFGAAQLIEALAYGAGCAFVAATEFFEHLLQLLGRGLGGQPFTDARGALTGGSSGESAASESIQRMRFGGFGLSRGHFGCVGHFVARKNRKHGFSRRRTHGNSPERGHRLGSQ